MEPVQTEYERLQRAVAAVSDGLDEFLGLVGTILSQPFENNDSPTNSATSSNSPQQTPITPPGEANRLRPNDLLDELMGFGPVAPPPVQPTIDPNTQSSPASQQTTQLNTNPSATTTLVSLTGTGFEKSLGQGLTDINAVLSGLSGSGSTPPPGGTNDSLLTPPGFPPPNNNNPNAQTAPSNTQTSSPSGSTGPLLVMLSGTGFEKAMYNATLSLWHGMSGGGGGSGRSSGNTGTSETNDLLRQMLEYMMLPTAELDEPTVPKNPKKAAKDPWDSLKDFFDIRDDDLDSRFGIPGFDAVGKVKTKGVDTLESMTAGSDSDVFDGFTTAFRGIDAVGKGLFALSPVVGTVVSIVGKLGETIAGSMSRIYKWNESLRQADFQFAEFSGSMARVKAEAEMRDIALAQERGERRARSASFREESYSEMKSTFAPVGDFFANMGNYLVGGLSKAAAGIGKLLGLRGEPAAAGAAAAGSLGIDTVIGMGTDFDAVYGRPIRMRMLSGGRYSGAAGGLAAMGLGGWAGGIVAAGAGGGP